MYKSWEDVKPQEGKQTYAMSLVGKVDFMFWGGSRYGGKSEIMSMVPLLNCEDPEFKGVFFRNTYKDLMKGGGLWDKAQSMYPLFGGISNVSNMFWKFPSGARQEYGYLASSKDAESYRGSGYTFMGLDEIDKFDKSWITFLMTCLRSKAAVNATMIGTLNPNPDSWCLPLVEYYLDEDGYPDPEKCGKIRYFIIDNYGDFVFADDEEYFKEHYPEYVYVKKEEGGEVEYEPPKTFTYVFFNIYDNKIGMEQEKKYLITLNTMPDHERKTQLYGNWYARPKDVALWNRDWIRGESGQKVISREEIPNNAIAYRGVDKAHTEPSATNRNPDYTAISPKIYKSKEGMYYLVGDYLDEIRDKKVKETDKPLVGRFRKLSGPRDALIVRQLTYDNLESKCYLVLPKDSGGGKSDGLYTKAKMLENSIKVIDDQSPSNLPDKKVKDFLPFATACQQGLVFICEESFPPATLNEMYRELELFNGEKSCGLRHDDWVDSIALAFNAAFKGAKPPVEFNLNVNNDVGLSNKAKILNRKSY